MVGVNFFGNFDLASLSIWLFWLFFAGLIYYLQTENMREGFPLEDEDGNPSANQGLFAVPSPKTFQLRDGTELTVPGKEQEDSHRRTDLAMARTAASEGFPHAPTGNPMADGVGPASWVPRRDEPEVDAHGKPKIVPMSSHEDFFVSAGYDPRGLPVLCKEDKVVATITDMWIDPAEHEVRYLEYELHPEFGTGKRLVPIQMLKIKSRWVDIQCLGMAHFDGVPQTASSSQITKLEEEKICGWYAGGTLYS